MARESVEYSGRVGEEVVAARTRILPGGSRPLVYSAASGSVQVVSPQAADLLARMEGCAPLPLAVRERGDLAAASRELARRGLLITREALLRALRGAADSSPAAKIPTVAWLTHGRPGALARSIRSFAENAARHGRVVRGLVCDDGGKVEAAQTLQALHPVAADGVLRLAYCGHEEKMRMAARLLEAAGGTVEPDLMRFALFGLPGYGTTCGANRNAAALASAGSMILVADDDTVCDPALHPDWEPGLAVTSARDPSDLLCFDSRDRVLASARLSQDDYIAAHESILGRTTGAVARAWPEGKIDLSGVYPALAETLFLGRDRIVATVGGVYGDAIVNDPTYLLWLEGEARDRVVASEESFRAALSSRWVLRCPLRMSIGDTDFAIGASLGLDYREMLPPFLPMGRGQDILFALTLHLCVPGSLVGRPSTAVLHDPVERRAYGGAPLPRIQAFDTLAVLERAHAFPAWASGPEERLRSLGSALEDLGRLPAQELAEALIAPVLRARGAQLAAAQELLDRQRGVPAYWAREVESHIRAMQDLIADRPVTPEDVEDLGAFGRQVALYGALLQAWPAIWGAAKQLSARGERLLTDLA